MLTVRGFYERHFMPIRLSAGEVRTIEAYDGSIRLWETICGTVPLGDVTERTLLKFVEGLRGHKAIKSVNTIRKHLRHIQAILDFAGPKGPRRRDAVGMLQEVPWVRPPRAIVRQPRAVPDEWIAAVYKAAVSSHPTVPRVNGVTPAGWWRAFISTAMATSLRCGALCRLPYDAVDWRAGTLHVPGEVQKGKRDQVLPLHEITMRDLRAIRKKDRDLLLPQPHTKKVFYAQWHRLLDAAGIEEEDRFGFHQLRRNALTALARHSLAAATQAAGHRSAQTTAQRYISQELLEDAVNSLPLFEQFE